MAKKIFVNLPVSDLDRSMKFFKKMGYEFNPQFTDETAACMVISDDIYTMLLTNGKFKEFTPKEIADSSKTTEVITCLSCDSKDELNSLMEKALSAGATENNEAKDYGFMYQRSYSDLDGHIWELVWMNEDEIPQEN